MRKRNAFTLVELLAVIVVLALIMVIAIPSVMTVTNKAKKESFYLFAQSLNSKATDKYITDLENDPDKTNCAVYDISKDLDIGDTDNYEGWVKIERLPINSGKASVSIDFNSSTPIQGAKYCIIKGSKCTPDTSYIVEESVTKATITNKVKEGQVMCANYQYPVGNVLNTSTTVCKTYSEGVEINDTYKYKVEVTLTDKSYVVQDYLLNDAEAKAKSDFYKVLDSNKKTPPSNDKSNPVKIASPRCSLEEEITYKGITNTKTTLVTTTSSTKLTCNTDLSKIDKEYSIKFNTYGGTKLEPVMTCTTCDGKDTLPTPTREGYTFTGWYYDSSFKKPVDGLYVRNVKTTEKRNSGNCLIGYNDVNLYAKWDTNGTTTTTKGVQVVDPNSTTTRGSTEVTTSASSSAQTVTIESTTTTNKDKTDYSVLLKSLSISGYDIGFDSMVFNYNLNVPNNVTNLNISYVANEPENVEVNVIGNENLNVGTNNVNVEVYNIYTGKKTMYTILVKRFDISEPYEPYPTRPSEEWNPESGLPDPTLEESNAQLSSLIISGYILNFDPQVYDYTLEIADEEKLAVTYRTAARNAVVVVTGNENIKDDSVIEVYVQSRNGYYNKTYKINLKRNIPESNSTKMLRTIAVVLVVLLVALLVFTSYHKKRVSKTIKKKDQNQNNNNNQNTTGV